MLTLKTTRHPTFNDWYVRTGKSCCDRCAGAVLLLLMSPLLVVLLILVRIILGPGVFFVQPRAGLHGKPFPCFKIRTMKPERRLNSQPHTGTDRRSGIPSPDDPRHTTFGTFLRRYGLDELPQLFNVLRGEMSIIGPRPELLHIAARYESHQQPRFAIKPGLTGIWQVTQRSAGVDLREFAAIDIEYMRTVSLTNDLRILCATPRAMLTMAAATECRRSVD